MANTSSAMHTSLDMGAPRDGTTPSGVSTTGQDAISSLRSTADSIRAGRAAAAKRSDALSAADVKPQQSTGWLASNWPTLLVCCLVVAVTLSTLAYVLFALKAVRADVDAWRKQHSPPPAAPAQSLNAALEAPFAAAPHLRGEVGTAGEATADTPRQASAVRFQADVQYSGDSGHAQREAGEQWRHEHASYTPADGTGYGGGVGDVSAADDAFLDDIMG